MGESAPSHFHPNHRHPFPFVGELDDVVFDAIVENVLDLMEVIAFITNDVVVILFLPFEHGKIMASAVRGDETAMNVGKNSIEGEDLSSPLSFSFDQNKI